MENYIVIVLLILINENINEEIITYCEFLVQL